VTVALPAGRSSIPCSVRAQHSALRAAIGARAVCSRSASRPPAWARNDPLPPGLSAGPVVLAPFVATSVGYDDNLFQLPVSPQGQAFTRTSLGLAARMPVRNSLFEARYQVDKRDYENYNPQRPREQTAGVQMRFNFGSGDALINDTFTRGASTCASPTRAASSRTATSRSTSTAEIAQHPRRALSIARVARPTCAGTP
jgi:hypothetical protein